MAQQSSSAFILHKWLWLSFCVFELKHSNFCFCLFLLISLPLPTAADSNRDIISSSLLGLCVQGRLQWRYIYARWFIFLHSTVCYCNMDASWIDLSLSAGVDIHVQEKDQVFVPSFRRRQGFTLLPDVAYSYFLMVRPPSRDGRQSKMIKWSLFETGDTWFSRCIWRKLWMEMINWTETEAESICMAIM